MECAKTMETTDPYPHRSIEGQSAGQGSKLNISQVQPAQIEPQEGHWLRMDPSLTRAVLAKTEEELLGSLAALMRNKVEHEQASRRFAQIQIDAAQVNHELDAIKEQIRLAEEEVATRLHEQGRINEEIGRVRQELATLRDGHQQYTEKVSSLKNEAAQTEQAIAAAHRNLSRVQDAAEAQLAAHRETMVQLDQVKNEKAALEETLVPLRKEVDERITAREALIAEAAILHRHMSDLALQKEKREAEVSELGNRHAELRGQLEDLRAEHGFVVSEMENLRQSVGQHAADKEKLQAGLADLHQAIEAAALERQRLQRSMAQEQSQVNDLLARKATLEQVIAEATDNMKGLHGEVAVLETRWHELTEAVEKAEQSRIAEGLPLLFAAEAHQIAPEWDPYPLESEFHTDEELDAKKVAELVSMLPGLEGCLITKNHGPVLASKMPERIHAHLKVPDRNYHLLFERLEKKLEEYNLQNAHLATFDLGEEALTVAAANHAFVFVNHRQTTLLPGLPDKLAAIVSQVARMYP
jgi:chromosome segregation ATPase